MVDGIISDEVCEELIKALRLQRHDFINHLQVIHGMLQLKRVDRAIQYIDDLAKNKDLLEHPLHLHSKSPNCEKESNNDLKGF